MSNSVLKDEYIFFDQEQKTKKELFNFIANQALDFKLITDKEQLINSFEKREMQGSTGFENGVAIPHAQNSDIKSPAVLIITTKKSLAWKSIDGQPTNFIVAILVPKKDVAKTHLDLISQISLNLAKPEVLELVKTTKDKDTIINLLIKNTKTSFKTLAKDVDNKNSVLSGKKFVGVSSCTTGVVHTYMCKELLEEVGKKTGCTVHIECQGQKGPEFVLSQKEIDEADAVVLATDVAIDLDRFANKKVYQCGTKPVVKNAEQVLKETLVKGAKLSSNNDSDFILSSAQGQKGILKHLLSGVSFMIPFVVFAGLIFAITNGIAKGIYGTNFDFASNYGDDTSTKHALLIIYNIANIGFTLMIPIMGAYISYSIAGRAGIAPAMIITWVLINPGGPTGNTIWWNWNGLFHFAASGEKIDANLPFNGNSNISWTLFGAIYGGLTAGYLVKYVNSWKVPKWLLPIMPIIFIPVFVTAFIAIPTAFFIAAPFGYLMGALDYGLSWLGLPAHAYFGFLVGLILGAMVGFDLGGPINKTAVMVATTLMAQDQGRLMGPVAAAIPIAPLGCALTSTILGRKLFTKQEQSLGVNAWLLGFMGISESAIPFAARDTWRAIVPNVIGSAVAGALAFVFQVQGHVGAWGSFIIALFGGVTDTAGSYIGIIWYVIAICVGAVVQSIIYTSLLLAKQGIFKKTYQNIINKLINKNSQFKNIINKNNK